MEKPDEKIGWSPYISGPVSLKRRNLRLDSGSLLGKLSSKSYHTTPYGPEVPTPKFHECTAPNLSYVFYTPASSLVRKKMAEIFGLLGFGKFFSLVIRRSFVLIREKKNVVKWKQKVGVSLLNNKIEGSGWAGIDRLVGGSVNYTWNIRFLPVTDGQIIKLWVAFPVVNLLFVYRTNNILSS